MNTRHRLDAVDRLRTSSSLVDDRVGGAGLTRINQLSNDDALTILDTRPSGLSTSEAQQRLHTYGPNRIERTRGESLLVSFLRQFIHFFALILWVAAALAFVAEWSAPGQGMAKVGLAIVVVIVGSGVFSSWQEYRAEQTLAGLRGLLPRRADVLREGKAIELENESDAGLARRPRRNRRHSATARRRGRAHAPDWGIFVAVALLIARPGGSPTRGSL